MTTQDAAVAGGSNKAEAARRTLKVLAERRLTPTPETFSAVYEEITGRRSRGWPQAILKDVLRDLVRSGRLSSQDAAQALQRARDGDWGGAHEIVSQAVERRHGATATGWPQTAMSLLKSTDALHPRWTRARKLEAVTRVIEAAVDHPDVALDRLTKLMESWGPALATMPKPPEPRTAEPATSNAGAVSLLVPTSPAAAPVSGTVAASGKQSAAARYVDPDAETKLTATSAAADAWKQVALRSMRLLEQSCGEGSLATLKLREYTAQHARPGQEDLGNLVPRFVDVVATIDRQIDEQDRIKAGLQRMLGLLCDNMRTLTPDEAWLAGQLEPIRALLGGPLTSADLLQAEHQLAMVVEKHAAARRSLNDTKLALKEMLATLIERIGGMGDSTGKFFEQIGGYQKQLEGAGDIETLSRVVQGLLGDTQVMRTDLRKSQEELNAARRRVETYEARVKELERELTQVSNLVQKDPLTRALNRRGLAEAFQIETARARRYGSALSFLILDIDDFKRLNDSLGHVAGDRALVHLAQTIQIALRPTDAFVRLGGEEFGVLLPATAIEDAKCASDRLLAELMRRPFVHDGKRHPMTFSGGVAQWKEDEPLERLIERADAALYRAKRAGKKRVLVAE